MTNTTALHKKQQAIVRYAQLLTYGMKNNALQNPDAVLAIFVKARHTSHHYPSLLFGQELSDMLPFIWCNIDDKGFPDMDWRPWLYIYIPCFEQHIQQLCFTNVIQHFFLILFFDLPFCVLRAGR